MNIQLKLPVSSPELTKSLIYKMERTFPDGRFELRGEATLFVSVERDGAALDEGSLNQFIHDFFSEASDMADRISPEKVFQRGRSGGDSMHPSGQPRNDIHGTNLKGVFWLGPQTRETFDLLDRVFLQFASKLGAQETRCPSLIAKSDLEKCGYLPKEIHQVGFVCTQRAPENALDFESACLSPAACLTTYPVFEKHQFLAPRTALTHLGSVFRHEGGKFSTKRPLERVWEYQVRELIFFGDTSYLEEIRQEYFNFLKNFSEKLDLSCEIVRAADLFFHREYSILAAYQLLSGTKYEFNLIFRDSDREERLALSSFNAHGAQFVHAFEMTGPSEDFQTFCIGFGIQRWIQAVLLSYPDLDSANLALRRILTESAS